MSNYFAVRIFDGVSIKKKKKRGLSCKPCTDEYNHCDMFQNYTRPIRSLYY